MADEKFSQFAAAAGTFDGSEKIAGLQTAANVLFTPQQIAGLAVQGVTGLNTDNTDPKNPIVALSVGAGLAGDGTPDTPLSVISPKVYIAVISQTGTAAPGISNVVTNDGYAGDISFTYSDVGQFRAVNSLPEFTIGKTILVITAGYNQVGSAGGFAGGDVSMVSVVTRNVSGAFANGVLAQSTIFITTLP